MLHVASALKMSRIDHGMKRGPFNEKQWKILKLRARGFTQRETAKKLGTSRANVSMIECRLRRKLEKARETVNTYESLNLSRKVSFSKSKIGTREAREKKATT